VIEYDRVLRATSERVQEKINLQSESEKNQKRTEAIIRLGGVLEKQKIPEKSLKA
jgi:hypothetical protein